VTKQRGLAGAGLRVVIGSAMLFLACATGVWAQTSGTIAGTVLGSDGPLEGASVRVRNLETGDSEEVRSETDGRYVLRVPPGSYDFFVSFPSYRGHVQRGVRMANGGTLQMNVELAEGPNFGVPGENGFLLQGWGKVPPDGPATRTADGVPDLSGVWFPSDNVDPEEPPYLDWARAVAQTRAADFSKDDPRASCLPTGVVRTMRFDLTKLVQSRDLLVILIEGSPPGFRQIFLDGRAHPADVQPSWMGHSVGTWDGDTLVVDTVGFNDRGWIDGVAPQTEQLHVVERFRRTDAGHIALEITIDDPGAYERPWAIRRSLALAQGYEIQEYVCNENLKTEHMVGAGTQK